MEHLNNIPGITCTVTAIDMEDSTDQAHVIGVKDENGRTVTINVAFGKITEVSCDEPKNNN